MTNRLGEVECVTARGSRRCHPVITELVIAGWTGRDKAAVESHIEELARMGVPRPPSTPTFYRVSASLVTTGDNIQTLGYDSSGEVEPVIIALDDGLWVGVGSDHTDRKAETIGISLAKQLCAKPVAPTLWRFDEVADQWDGIELRSYTVRNGKREIYQDGKVSVMLRPEELIERYVGGGGGLAPGTAMFCGTMAVKDEIAPADAFEMAIRDPVLDREIFHSYTISPLPIAG